LVFTARAFGRSAVDLTRIVPKTTRLKLPIDLPYPGDQVGRTASPVKADLWHVFGRLTALIGHALQPLFATKTGVRAARYRPCTTRRGTAAVPERELSIGLLEVGGMSDVAAAAGLGRSLAGRNRDTVCDSRQNVIHGQNESVDAIDAQGPGARLGRVENCKRITR
jgi:hypothetical protein